MAPRAVVLALLSVLALPHALADPVSLPPPEPIIGCITVDVGPPPYYVIGECEKLRVGAYVNAMRNGTNEP